MNSFFNYFIYISVSVVIFVLLVVLVRFIIGKVGNSSINYFNPTQYLPEEEIQSLKQSYYLLMILLLFIILVNFFFDNDIIMSNSQSFYLLHGLLDILVSAYIVSILYEKSYKRMILIVCMIPIASISFLLFGDTLLEYLNIVRIPALIYLIKYFYDRFRVYTTENGLGFSIMLLFVILFISIIVTMFIENEDPLNAVVMVSNAFTSNGYAILGETTGGKINSIFLVWSGYVLSGAATATLTAGILVRRFKGQLEEYDMKLDEVQSSLEDVQSSLDELKGQDEKLDELKASLDELKR